MSAEARFRSALRRDESKIGTRLKLRISSAETAAYSDVHEQAQESVPAIKVASPDFR
jgi:hypothetical protein